jgi:flagellar biosynthetic protein FliR
MELMIEKLLGFMMVLTRISALFLVLPVFGWKIIPSRIKIAMAVLLAIFHSTITPLAVNTSETSVLEAILLLANEGTYGLSLGLVATVLFSAVKVGGRIVERQMGLAMAQILDPLTGESSQPLGSLLEMVFVVMFLNANGHHFLLSIISRSYETFPAGSIPTIPVLAGGVVKAGSALLSAGLMLAAPILAAFLVLLIVLAVLARMVPEMNILFISLPVRVGLGLLMTAIFLPLVSAYLSEFADWMDKLLPV